MRLLRPYGKYFSESVPVPADFATGDSHLIGLINGTDGGLWEPTARINFGGAGLQLGGNVKASTPRTLVIRMGVHEYADTVTPTGKWRLNVATGDATAPVGNSTFFMNLSRAHDGATLSQVRIFFKVPLGKTALPANYPLARLLRSKPGGGVDSLTSAINNIYPTQSNLAAYINGGNPNALVITPNQNNVIDKSQWFYDVSFKDDDNMSAPFNTVVGVEMTLTNITDYRLP